jgi:uncharacterized protein YndB with AHSA1/START domain
VGLGAATVRRSRLLDAGREAVWEVVADPHHQPRWWPRVERVEGVHGAVGGHFTQVFRSERGRIVRADYTIAALAAPELAVWHQELAGSPFARVLERAVLQVRLEPGSPAEPGSPPRTAVTIVSEQQLRGSSRTGAFLLRRATARRLDEALDGLAAVLGG